MTESKPIIYFPGQEIDKDFIIPTTPTHIKNMFRIGNGLHQDRNNKIIANKMGYLKKQLIFHSPDTNIYNFYIDNYQKYYNISVNDNIIGVITDRHSEYYIVNINPAQYAYLHILAFEGASKHNRPELQIGALVYCRVSYANNNYNPLSTINNNGINNNTTINNNNIELSCISLISKKEWMTKQSIYGELKGGFVFNTSINFCSSLLLYDYDILGAIGNYVPFEVAIGDNGRIWIHSENIKTTIVIYNILSTEFLTKDKIEEMLKMVFIEF